eukprot:6925899-Karenia_brevis.AAC.1
MALCPRGAENGCRFDHSLQDKPIFPRGWTIINYTDEDYSRLRRQRDATQRLPRLPGEEETTVISSVLSSVFDDTV